MSDKARCYTYDFLRVICAILVCIFHFEGEAVRLIPDGSVLLGAGVTLNFLGSGLNLGSLAVALFFMLSGALTAGTLRDDCFVSVKYIQKRLKRLLPPLWIAWTLACVWMMIRGSFRFDVPASRFILTILGVDGYAAIHGIGTFYLVGEWFYGAIVLVTLCWPLVRACYRKCPYAAMLLLALAEAAALLFLNGPWTSVPVCLTSFSTGAFLANADLSKHGAAIRAAAVLVIIGGLLASAVSPTIRCQIVAAGIFVFVELSGERAGGGAPSGRSKRVLVRLSGLTLYFFMFQHIVENEIVEAAAPHVTLSFGTFDYWGLAILTVIITGLIAGLVGCLDRSLRGLLS
ncbi:MAG TPA: acyltransferase [Candidatus Olsenella avistercoris]|nr:acyltransferase [Candidatus Olsenella avistercoris]